MSRNVRPLILLCVWVGFQLNVFHTAKYKWQNQMTETQLRVGAGTTGVIVDAENG
jgi:hypothetical protein